MTRLPKNQIKFIVGLKLNDSRELEKAILSIFYGIERKFKIKKTDDKILLYMLGFQKDARKQFVTKFKSWRTSKDKNLTEELLKLFFLSAIVSENRFKKEIIFFLENTSQKNIKQNLKPVYIFLEKKYKKNENKIEEIETNEIFSLIANLFLYYEYNNKKFYETQIKILNEIEEKVLTTYEKIALILFSENEKFEGIQLNREDSLDYLKKNNERVFHKFIDSVFKKSFFGEKKSWTLLVIFAGLIILNFLGKVTFKKEYTLFIAKINIAWLTKILNSTNILLTSFLFFVSTLLIYKLYLFKKELKK